MKVDTGKVKILIFRGQKHDAIFHATLHATSQTRSHRDHPGDVARAWWIIDNY